ncbi:dihydroxyacetone kinase operon transcriptional regulator DhaR [Alginatibacterium sediminis]|nr:dihydroxyacetone kinase operon transcriptional regulator DhaR [Alginatibacterium sediminis]
MSAQHSDSLNTLLEEKLSRWEFFQKHRWVAPEHALSPVIQSWERCCRRSNAYQWNKPAIASGATLESLLKRSKDLTTLSAAVLEDSEQYQPQRRLAIVVSDISACCLKFWGDQSLIQNLQALGLARGSYWNEDQIGTNALALALHNNEATSVFASEHFQQALHLFSCHAAPIFDDQGKPYAAVMIVSDISNHHGGDLALVASYAKEIGNLISLENSVSERNTLICQRDAVLESIDDGLIAWDENQRISFINRQAQNLFNRQRDRIIGCKASELFRFPPLIMHALQERSSLSHVDITFECDNDFVSSKVTVRPLNDGSWLFFMHPEQVDHKSPSIAEGSRVERSFSSLIAQSKNMQQLVELARKAALSLQHVLLVGEEGVGKNQIAQAIHYASPNRDAPFVILDGKDSHVLAQLQGLLERPNDAESTSINLRGGGTLYLEQIEFLPSDAQSLLLQICKSSVYSANTDLALPNLRIICSSCSDIQQAISAGEFRRQLYFELSSIELHVPSLRHRPEDLSALINHQLRRLSDNTQSTISISSDALEILQRYQWPGNIAELKHHLRSALQSCVQEKITVNDLPQQCFASSIQQHDQQWQFVQNLETVERQTIQHAWDVFDGQIKPITQALGVSRTTLWRKLKQYGIR